MKYATLVLLIIAAAYTQATKVMQPSLADVVEGAEQIGLLRVQAGRSYHIEDEFGELHCGYLYDAKWIAALTKHEGALRFRSDQPLTPGSINLVFLADNALPRQLISTNSRSEWVRSQRLVRLANCYEMAGLPQTLHRATTFPDKTFMAPMFQRTVFLPSPGYRTGVDELDVRAENISIAGSVYSRDELVDAFFDNGDHLWLSEQNFAFVGSRFVEWSHYCDRIVNTYETQQQSSGTEHQERATTFCSLRTLGLDPTAQ